MTDAKIAGIAKDQLFESERPIELSREDAELILSLLENPPKPNDAARLHERLIGG